MMPDRIQFNNLEDYEIQMDRFAYALVHIQQRHNLWFESRHGEFEKQEDDTIGNHVSISFQYPKLIFGYWADSQLPENIRSECNVCFDEIFKGS